MKMIFNFEKKIESLLTEKPTEVIAHVNCKIPDNFQFDIFKRQYIEKLWISKGICDYKYAIYINKNELKEMDFSATPSSNTFIENLLELIADGTIINVNKELKVVSKNQCCNGIINYCYDISKSNNYVFLLTRNGIKIVIDGEIIYENSLFVDEQDQIDYLRKMDISQINEVFSKYQEYLNISDNINIFFEDEISLNSVPNASKYKNILKNKPEKFIKKHLKTFLNKNIRRTFNMNYFLNHSEREIDLYTEDKDFYFITVKWLGISVNETGNNLNPPNTEYDARSGVTQTLEYVRELREFEGFSERTLQKCYLVVFDARDIKTPINYGIERIDDDLRHYKNHFDTIEEIKIDRNTYA